MAFWLQIMSSLKQRRVEMEYLHWEMCFGSLQGHSAFMEEEYQPASVFYW